MDFRIPIGDWIAAAVEFLLEHFTSVFDAIALVIEIIVESFETALLAVPAWVLVAVVVALATWRVGWRFGAVALAMLLVIAGMELWDETVATLALILSSTVVSLAFGIPLGIWAAKSDRVDIGVRPILDLMQTMPPFVYLIPAAMFFGLGKVPGAIATVVFAMPPAVRLTNLGIRLVSRDLVEAGQAFGCTGRQLLVKVELPNAMPSIMAGVNQTVMLALSMVVIASMIGAGGLGNEVLRGIQRLDIGLGFEGGIGVVILAVLLDRIMQSFGTGTPGMRRSPLLAAVLGRFGRRSDGGGE